MLTEQQLEMRKSGIGGSDVATILGLNPWRTPLQLWAEKIGKLEPQEQNAAMEWGSRLEAAIFQKFDQEHDDYQCSYGSGTIRHADKKHYLSTPDGFIYDKIGRRGVLEVKTSGQQPWDEVPIYYMLQAQHYCYVLDKDFYMFAVLFRGTEYREYGPFEFDREAYEHQVVPVIDSFWDAVEKESPDGFTPANLNDLNLIVDVDGDVEIKADVDMTVLLHKYHLLKSRVDEADAELSEVKLQIAGAMGDASKVVNDEGYTLVGQVQTSDTKVVDAKRFKDESPELFEKYSKVKKGYRAIRVYRRD